ncbi:tricarballylate utilization protein B [Burkholderia territorii]|nr:tricarballylate utilization protein B [Burkholderia territorii]
MQQSDPLAPEHTRTAISVDTKKMPRDSMARVIPIVPMSASETEVARQMQICNACRYCEGFCAVFPAMTRRLEFGKADVNHLANLCHNSTYLIQALHDKAAPGYWLSFAALCGLCATLGLYRRRADSNASAASSA